MKITDHNHCQCYVNMVRIANDSVYRSLRSGRLVKSITVYALLVLQTDLSCVPMKYYSDFKEPPIISFILEGNFAEFIYCIFAVLACFYDCR